MKDNKFEYRDLVERLEDFAANIIRMFDKKLESFAADYLAKQLIRSSCSSALNYGEVIDAGSEKDKIYKLHICLKELRESMHNLRIQMKADLISPKILTPIIDENDQLIRIIVVRIRNLKAT